MGKRHCIFQTKDWLIWCVTNQNKRFISFLANLFPTNLSPYPKTRKITLQSILNDSNVVILLTYESSKLKDQILYDILNIRRKR